MLIRNFFENTFVLIVSTFFSLSLLVLGEEDEDCLENLALNVIYENNSIEGKYTNYII